MKFYKGTEQQKADPKTACHKTKFHFVTTTSAKDILKRSIEVLFCLILNYSKLYLCNRQPLYKTKSWYTVH